MTTFHLFTYAAIFRNISALRLFTHATAMPEQPGKWPSPADGSDTILVDANHHKSQQKRKEMVHAWTQDGTWWVSSGFCQRWCFVVIFLNQTRVQYLSKNVKIVLCFGQWLRQSDSNAWSWPVEPCDWLARCTWHCRSWSEKSSVQITLYINFGPQLPMTSCRKCSSTYERGLIFSVAEQRVSNLFLQGAEVVWMVSIPQRIPADTCRGPTLLLEPGSQFWHRGKARRAMWTHWWRTVKLPFVKEKQEASCGRPSLSGWE